MRKKTVAVIAFAVYILLLIWLVLFKLEVNIADLPRYRDLILIPFSRPGAVNMRTVVMEIIDNILFFIPLGLLLSALGFPKKAWGRVLAGFLLSLFFETIQYAFAIGTADVTDLIDNTLGTLIGVAAYLGIARLLKDKAAFVTGTVILSLETLAAGGYLFLLLANR